MPHLPSSVLRRPRALPAPPPRPRLAPVSVPAPVPAPALCRRRPHRTHLAVTPLQRVLLDSSYLVGQGIVLFTMYYTAFNWRMYRQLNAARKKKQQQQEEKEKEAAAKANKKKHEKE